MQFQQILSFIHSFTLTQTLEVLMVNSITSFIFNAYAIFFSHFVNRFVHNNSSMPSCMKHEVMVRITSHNIKSHHTQDIRN